MSREVFWCVFSISQYGSAPWSSAPGTSNSTSTLSHIVRICPYRSIQCRQRNSEAAFRYLFSLRVHQMLYSTLVVMVTVGISACQFSEILPIQKARQFLTQLLEGISYLCLRFIIQYPFDVPKCTQSCFHCFYSIAYYTLQQIQDSFI